MYAPGWFRFHDYAADPATSNITISLPPGFQLVGFSDTAVSTASGKTRFVQSTPALLGNFAYGKYAAKTLHMGDQELQFFAKPGNDKQIAGYGETFGKVLDYYAKAFGPSDSAKRLT